MRTTVTIDDELLAQAKLIAVSTHRTIGSVLEDALRALIADHTAVASGESFLLPDLAYDKPGLNDGVDLFDRDQLADLLGDNETHALP